MLGSTASRKLRWLMILVLAIGMLVWGFAIGKYRAFPLPQIMAVKSWIFPGEEDPTPGVVEDPAWEMTAGHFSTLETQPDIVMLGDSITASGEWNELFPEASIANRGIHKDTTEGVLRRIGEVRDRNPRLVFLMVGINDFARRVDADQIYDRYAQIVDQLADDDTRVHVQSTLLPGKDVMAERRDEIVGLNSRLEKKCQEPGLEFIDLNELLAPDGFLLGEYSLDGIHLTGTAYQVWADSIRGRVEQSATQQ